MRTLRLAILLAACLPAVHAANVISTNLTCPASGNKPLIASAGVTTRASWIVVQANTANTGVVNVGDRNVTTTKGGFMFPTGSVQFPLANSAVYEMSSIYIACTVNTDTVTILYAQ